MKKISKLLLALSFVLSVTTSAFAVTVVSWGGAYTESQKLGYGDPTAAKLGIPVDWVDYTGGLSEVKAQKEAGAITWDIMDVYAKDTIIGCDEGIFHEFDFDKDFILKVPNSSNRIDIKEGREINIGWNSIDCRALDPK